MFKKVQKLIQWNSTIFILSLILIFASILRYKGLVFQSYWFDELFSVYVSNPENSLSAVISTTISDVHPPLYQILLWCWYNIFGYTDWSGRALSVFFGTLSVFTSYLMAKEFYNKEIGLYAATIASVNYFLVYYSQETRAYIFLFFLTTLSYMYFIRLIRKYQHIDMVFYLFYTIALMYTHYYSLFLIFTQFIVFIYILYSQISRRVELLNIGTKVTITLSLAILPLIAPILRLTDQSRTWMETPQPWFMVEYMKGYVLSPFLHKIFLFMIMVVLLTLFFRKNSNRIKTATYILLIWIFAGYLVPYIRSIVSVPLLSPKNTIIILPALITLVSLGIYKLKFKWVKLGFIFSIIFFSLYHLFRMEYYSTVTKDQFREVLYEINKFHKKLPVYDIIMHQYTFDSYYFATQAKILKLDFDIRTSQELVSNLEEGKANCFWVLQAHKDYLREGNILKKKSLRRLKVINKYQAQGILFGYEESIDQCQEIMIPSKKEWVTKNKL
jgi:uncharacterized membrane protein